MTERQIAYYAERARGGVGLIITEHAGIAPEGKASDNMTMIWRDEYIAGLRRLVAAVHGAGSKIAVQINHAGKVSRVTNRAYGLIAPSVLPNSENVLAPRALLVEELPDLALKWAEAAARVKETGADGVEIHMAHGYLLAQFLSPLTNTRVDGYGGNAKGRMRFPIEVLRAVRERVGREFPVWCRVSGSEFLRGGFDIEQTKGISAELERWGADAIHVSAGSVAGSLHMVHPTYYRDDGPNVWMAAEVKSVVKLPVIAVGKIRDPFLADQVIREGLCDFVALGRTLIADPYFPRKAREGKEEDVVPCLSCNRCIRSQREMFLQCAVNPLVGKEAGSGPEVKRAKQAKRVVIVGGGVAGLKAAEACAVRGHRVTVLEKESVLGGQLNLAMIPPGKTVLLRFKEYLERKVKNSGADIQMNTEATRERVETLAPDVLIIASGARPLVPDFPGQESLSKRILTIVDVLREDLPGLGKNILVIGGGIMGAELADYLASRGKAATIVEMRTEIAYDAIEHFKYDLRERLQVRGVEILTGTKVMGFDGDRVICENRGGKRVLTGFDSIVAAMGSQEGQGLDVKLRGTAETCLVIGDAAGPREIMDAVHEGAAVCQIIESNSIQHGFDHSPCGVPEMNFRMKGK